MELLSQVSELFEFNAISKHAEGHHGSMRCYLRNCTCFLRRGERGTSMAAE